MATLGFKINADYEKVIRLRDEIHRLQGELSKVNMNTPKEHIHSLEEQLEKASKEFKGLTKAAMQTGASMDGDFKSKIAVAKVAVNEMTNEIIKQKEVIKKVSDDVKSLADKYREASKAGSSNASSLKKEYDAAKKSLDQEKGALFELTQQQAKANLSVKQLKDEYDELSKNVDKSKESNEGFSLSLGKTLGIIGGVTALKQLGSEIVRVRGQFQDMETQIETLVGKDTTAKIMPQIKEMAKVSPLTMTDIVGAEKMMLSFNIQAEDSVKYLRALSDVSMGNSQKFNSLTLAFSQMSSAGRLMGQDLLQMINAGFNPLQTISQKTGKSIAKLKEEMSKGAISAEMVQQAFIDATSAGGKFYNMSENAAKTINGQISMLEDAWDAALNEIGQSSEGLIIKGIKGMTTLIQAYEKVGMVLVGLVATYGTYRAGVMLATLAESKHTLAQMASIKAKVAARKAQALLNKTMLNNPYVIATMAVVALTAAMIKFATRQTEAEKAQKRLDDAFKGASKSAESERIQIDQLFARLKAAKKGTEEYAAAKNAIMEKYGSYLTKLGDEKTALDDVAAAYRAVTEGARNAAMARQLDSTITSESEISAAKITDIKAAVKKELKAYYGEAKDADGVSLAEQYYLKIVPVIEGKEEVTDDIQRVLNEVRRKSTYGERMKGSSLYIQPVEELVKDAQKENERYKKTIDDAYALFGKPSEGGKTDDKTFDATKASLDELMKQLPNAKTALEALKAAEKPDAKAIAAKKDEVKQIEDNIVKREKELKIINEVEAQIKKLREEQKKHAVDDAEYASLEKRIQALQKKLPSASTQYNKEMSAEQGVEKAEREALKKRTETIKQVTQRISDLKIEGEEDIAERTRKQREEENKKEIEAIKKERDEYVEAYIEAEKKIFEAKESELLAQNPKYQKKTFDRDAAKKAAESSTGYGLYGTLIEATNEKQKEDAKRQEEKDRLEYLREYGDYKQKVEAITKEYGERIAKAANQWEKKSLEAERDKILEELAHAQNAEYKNIFKDPSKMSLKTVKEAIKLANDEIKKITSKGALSDDDLQTIKALQEAVDKLQSYADSAPFDNLDDGLDGVVAKLNNILSIQKRIKAAKKSGNTEALLEAQEEMKAAKENLTENLIGVGVDAFADGLKKAASYMAEIAAISGDVSLKETAEILGGTANVVSSVASGAASGGWIGALVGGITSIFGEVSNSLLESQVSIAKNQKAMEDYAMSMKLQALSLDEGAYSTMFGERLWERLRKTGEKLKDAKKEFASLTHFYMYTSQSQGHSFGSNIYYDKNYESVYGKQRGALSLSQALIDKGGGLMSLGKLFSDLDIFDEDGNLRLDKIEEAKIALESLNSMDLTFTSGRDKLDDAIKLAEKYKEHAEALKAAAQNYLGTIGDSLGDAIVNGILKGEDAIKDFGSVAGGIIEQIAKDFASSWMIENYLSNFEESMQNAFASGDATQVTDVVNQIVAGLPTVIETAEAATKEILDMTKGTDYDLYKKYENESQQASSKGYGTLSEETGKELSGRALAQYESNLRIEASQRESTMTLLDMRGTMVDMVVAQQSTNFIAEDCRQLIAQSYIELQAIRENTDAMVNPIKNLSEKINKWDSKIMEL